MPSPTTRIRESCEICSGCVRHGDGHQDCRRCECPPNTRNIIGPDHPDWAVPAVRRNTDAAGGEVLSWGRFCGQPYDRRYTCTRMIGHDGDHAVHVDFHRQIIRWHGTRTIPPICSNCGSEANRCPETYCRERAQCTNCCRCNNVPYREQSSGFIGDPTDMFPRHVAVEIECGKISNAKIRGFRNVKACAEKWGFRVGSDGSISEFSAATEISTTPARGDAFPNQIKELGAALLADDLRANKSCGLHCHVNVRDYTTQHLLNFMWLYHKVEKPLYRIVARSRRTNHYCRMWGDRIKASGCLDGRLTPTERLRRIDIMCYGDENAAREVKSQRSKHDSRYHGLNLNSISVHGTIEFRMHHGTVNPEKIVNWSAVCVALVQYAFTHTEEECRSLKGTNAEILEKIIGTSGVIAWTRARRLLFVNMERKEKGLAPHARPERPAVGRRQSIPRIDPGEVEMSEELVGGGSYRTASSTRRR